MILFDPKKTLQQLMAVLMVASMVAVGSLPSVSMAVGVDLVNDDTDIFLTNPAITAQRPNILIIMDNTANWSRNVGGQSIFINEKNALVNVVNNLGEEFNLGTMFFAETGTGNDNVDGSYLRYSIRQMTDANKTVLANAISGLDENNDKGNNNTIALAMLEAYRYFAGEDARASVGKAKTDMPGNTLNEAIAAGLSGQHLSQVKDTAQDYTSPIADSCQKNYIIYISNGTSNENASALAISETELATLTSTTPPDTISISPNGQQGNWMDEWAKYMANIDVNDDIDGDQFVYTYVVEVDPSTTGQGPDMTGLMKSVASNGKGSYFAVSSENSGSAIVSALQEIFNEIQSVNSVFAATTLPVSVNVRGTNLNQVYVGVFRPDAARLPRWFGNLKAYKLGLNTTTDSLFLADSTGVEAENPSTGFIKSGAVSFWTGTSSFWSFRSDDQNGDGLDSDSPDGDLVEKGGAAQGIREDWPTDQTSRNLYTCTDNSVSGQEGVDENGDPITTSCKAATLPDLEDYRFETGNKAIDIAALDIAAVSVDSLTGKVAQTLDSLTTVRDLEALTTASGTISVSSLDNGATSLTLSSLTNVVSKSITSINNNAVTISLDSLIEDPTNTASATYSVGHGYSTGDAVTIAGATNAKYNGTFTIVVDSSTVFHYTANGIPASGGPSATSTKSSSVVTINVPSHGFSSGQSVTISGVTPSDYNGTYNVTVLDTDNFQILTASPLAPATVMGNVAASTSTTATGTTAVAHGYSAGDTVTIAGASDGGYNGAQTITSVPTTTTFTYTIPSGLAVPTGTITSTKGTTTVTATTAVAHGLLATANIVIFGSDIPGYNGTYTIDSVPTPTTFTYTTASVEVPNPTGTIGVAVGTSTTAKALLTDHGFTNGDTIRIAGAVPADYNGDHVITVVSSSLFSFDVSPSTPVSATTLGTARKFPTVTTNTAYATLVGHGYSTSDSITISDATPGQYNGTFSITKITDDLFSYDLGGTAAAAAAGTIEASITTTTAVATAINHGFSDGDSVTISGASPSPPFNGTKTITYVDANTFTYTLASAQGDATGTISATGATTDARADLINWVRGEDNSEDENSDASTTDIRSTVHGDVLHSRPAVINYNRYGDDNDVYVFYGSNDGIFHAVKGGFGNSADALTAGEPEPGTEVWGFIPEEFFPSLRRLRNNDPKIGSTAKKPYFADGSIGVYYHDGNGNDKILAADSGDRVILYISMRRGGRLLYALDVTDPKAPKLAWQRDNTSSSTTGNWAELGQTWSVPQIVDGVSIDMNEDGAINTADGDLDGTTPLLVFGAGYDAAVEDINPDDIAPVDQSTTVTATSVTHTGTVNRSMGRGILVVNGLTGDIVFQAGTSVRNVDPSPDTYLSVSGMDYAIPSDMLVLTNKGGSVKNRAYVGDTGGNVWRFDFGQSKRSEWAVTKLASIADVDGSPDLPEGMRKFLYPPEVVYHRESSSYDAVLMGSGDREHPFDEGVQNRFYMFKDFATGAYALDTGLRTTGTQSYATIAESGLFDATSNCAQDSSACSGSGDEADQATAITALGSHSGWYITLAEGEKVVTNAVVLNEVTFFNTNTPSSVAGTGSCTSDLGEARQYQVIYDDATVSDDVNVDGTIDKLDRSTVHAGGGYLPSPVPVVVEIDGKIKFGVISGVKVSDAPGTLFGARTRKFWFKNVD